MVHAVSVIIRWIGTIEVDVYLSCIFPWIFFLL